MDVVDIFETQECVSVSDTASLYIVQSIEVKKFTLYRATHNNVICGVAKVLHISGNCC